MPSFFILNPVAVVLLQPIPLFAMFPVVFVIVMFIMPRLPSGGVIGVPVLTTVGLFLAVAAIILLQVLIFPEYATDEVRVQ
jgi:hypothetical protein